MILLQSASQFLRQSNSSIGEYIHLFLFYFLEDIFDEVNLLNQKFLYNESTQVEVTKFNEWDKILNIPKKDQE